MIYIFYKSQHIKRSHLDDAAFDLCKKALHLGQDEIEKNWVLKVDDFDDEGGYYLNVYDSKLNRKILIQPKWEDLTCECCGSEDSKVTGYTVITDFKVTQNQTAKTQENELKRIMNKATHDYNQSIEGQELILKRINKAK